MRRFLALLVLATATSLAACDNDDAPSEATAIVPEADVARFQTEVFLETIPLDSALAAAEGAAATAPDSVVQAAYGPVLERLREARRRLQLRVDTLSPMPRAAFDSVRADVGRRLASLRTAVGRAGLDATPTADALRAAVAADLAALDPRLAVARAAATSDTTGRRTARLDSLDADRARLAARLEAYPDTSEAQFAPFRQRVLRDALALRQRAEGLAADTAGAATARPAPAPAPRRRR